MLIFSVSFRKNKNLSKAKVGEFTGINRSLIGRIENEEFISSIKHLQALSEVLDFEATEFAPTSISSFYIKHLTPFSNLNRIN